jgi:hypothetical protein
MKNVKVGMVLALLLVWVGMAAAAMDFSADMVSSMKGKVMNSKVYMSQNKYRTEAAGMISIVRMDKNVMWSVMPAKKMYMENAIPQQSQVGMSSRVSGEIKREKLGREKVNGIDCDRWLITYKDPASAAGRPRSRICVKVRRPPACSRFRPVIKNIPCR